jgi:hypothetical protein
MAAIHVSVPEFIIDEPGIREHSTPRLNRIVKARSFATG